VWLEFTHSAIRPILKNDAEILLPG
jgi:hypothetical protein